MNTLITLLWWVTAVTTTVLANSTLPNITAAPNVTAAPPNVTAPPPRVSSGAGTIGFW